MGLMQEDLNIVLSILFACLLLYLITKVLLRPIIFLLKILYRGITGFIILILINFTIGSLLQFQLGLNPITAIIVGVLGFPGAALIYGLKALLG